jgi:CRP-like cAMP-binding protein
MEWEQYEYLNLFHRISTTEFCLLTENFRTRVFKKGDYITVPGQIQKELYFVKKGVQMSYFETENKTHVIAFTYPPNLCAISESFQFQKPSKYFLKSLTDSELE